MRNATRWFGLALLSLGLVSFKAIAEIRDDLISDYNTAVTTGTPASAVEAAKALIADAIANPEDPRQTSVLYEGAQFLCLRNECDAAQGAAETLMQNGDGADKAKGVALIAFADFQKNQSGRNRDTLAEALKAIESHAPDTFSVSAFSTLYGFDTQKGRWRDAMNSLDSTVIHLDPVKAQYPSLYYPTSRNAVIADFMYRHSTDSLRDLVTHYAKIRQMRSIEDARGDVPDWLETEYWESDAWVRVAEAWFMANNQQNRILTEAQREDILETYPPVDVLGQSTNGPQDSHPFCEGELHMRPRLDYPTNAAFRGLIGVVTLRMEFDDAGNVINPEVLASVPIGGFEEETIETVSNWRWEPNNDQDLSTCRLNRSNVILPVSYTF